MKGILKNNFMKLGVFILLISMAGCEDMFEYSPYDTHVKSKYQNQTQKNIIELSKNEFKNEFKIAFITDTHTYYDEFNDQIKELNKRNDIDFIVHGGDLTLSSLHKEYEWFSEIMNKSKVPFLTVIGNHDYLSNGADIYQKMFGATNYSFTYNNIKFVFFDNVIWEKGLKDPDFDWFRNEIKNTANNRMVIPISHIPPWDQQFNYGNEYVFNKIMEEQGIKLSIHGHTHKYYFGKKYGPVDYLVCGDSQDKEYIVITFKDSTYKIERVKF